MMSRQLVLALCILSTVLTNRIQLLPDTPNGPQLVLLQNLTFENSTGKGATQQMLDSFRDWANFAYFSYRDDMEKTTKYIKYRMDELYGKESDNFYIFVQTDAVISGRYFWVNVDSVYAALNGINKLKPEWSYFFVRNYGSKSIAQYIFTEKNQTGSGVSPSLLNSIKSLISAEDSTSDTCLCTRDSLQRISKGTQGVTSSAWTVICDDKGVTSSLFRTFNKRYVSLKGKLCYYTMYQTV